MKKTIAFGLTGILVLALAGCGAERPADDGASANTVTENAPGDISHYLVTFDVAADSFGSYFECITYPVYDESGSLCKNEAGFMLKSKLYDHGYSIYDYDEIEIETIINGSSHQNSLDELLNGDVRLSGAGIGPGTAEFGFSGRLANGKIRFLDKDYVTSYKIPEPEKPDRAFVPAEITLQNGEVLTRNVHPDHPY